MAIYFNAFHELDFERDASSFEPIKRSVCFEYARDYGFDDLQTDDLWYYISRMDKGYLKYRHSQLPKDKKPTGQRSKQRGR
jgi:hypothetical protein